jgi:tetratricopeptide (TPR) repeat protein
LKKQLILGLSALALVILLFAFGRTTDKKNPVSSTQESTEKLFEVNGYVDSLKRTLPPSQALYISKLENGISRGDVPAQQITAYTALASFWKDTIHAFEPYAFYTIKAAKLDNSEKSLTFAARLMLDNLRHEQDEAKLNWKTAETIALFESALKLNPENDELKIGLGSAYVFGKGRAGNPEATMKGIQQLLSVVRKDSNNTKAQMVLGIGGLMSGQYDKALERFKRIVMLEPNNLEAVAYLADTYAAKGERAEAIKWYNASKKLVNDPRYSQQVDERIKQIR